MEEHKQLRELLARAFPNGIVVPKERMTIERRVKRILDYLEKCGWYIRGFDMERHIIEYGLFVGDPHAKRGVEIRNGISAEYMANATFGDIVEAFSALAAGQYAQAMEDMAKKFIE